MNQISLYLAVVLVFLSSETCLSNEPNPILVLLKNGRSFPVQSIESTHKSGYIIVNTSDKSAFYKTEELDTILNYQDVMFSVYEDGRRTHFDEYGLPFKYDTVRVDKYREYSPVGLLSVAFGLYTFYHWDKKNDQINARDIFRKRSETYSKLTGKAKHHEFRERVGAVGVLFFLYQGFGAQKYSIRTDDGTLIGMRFRPSGLVATLNW
jgi:hypothetical protein